MKPMLSITQAKNGYIVQYFLDTGIQHQMGIGALGPASSISMVFGTVNELNSWIQEYYEGKHAVLKEPTDE
jgi:hypothetical protein